MDTLFGFFLKGGFMMWPILFLLIAGLAVCIERFVTLMRASTNTNEFLKRIKAALQEGGVSAAAEECANTRGPVATIFHAGLLRVDRGIDHVEKAVMNAGTIEMAFLEKNLIWLSFVMAAAPMLGFMGTVAGMIVAFEEIAAANDISPAIVAGGISQALLTTFAGLVVAVIIQFFHNFFIARIDKLIVDMEESSTEFVDILVEMQMAKN